MVLSSNQTRLRDACRLGRLWWEVVNVGQPSVVVVVGQPGDVVGQPGVVKAR